MYDGDGEDDTLELLWNFAFTKIYSVCLSVLKLAPAEYATNAFSSKQKYQKLAVVGPIVKKLENWLFHVVVLQRTAKKNTKNYNARAQLLYCSFNLLFGDVLVAVAIVF